jgi:hypothetical protein
VEATRSVNQGKCRDGRGCLQLPHVRHAFMIPANDDRHHGRHPHAFIILPEVPELAVLFRDGHGREIVRVPDRLEVAAEEEEVGFRVGAGVRGEDGGVDGVEGAVGAALDCDLGGRECMLGGKKEGLHAC